MKEKAGVRVVKCITTGLPEASYLSSSACYLLAILPANPLSSFIIHPS
jgi:hypothetical protein